MCLPTSIGKPSMGAGTCECGDPGCTCAGHCNGAGTIVLYRVDMVDETGTLMCEHCASDALDSELFTDEEPEA